MHAPQITLISLFVLGIGSAMAKHGEPQTGTHNVFTTMIGAAITSGILWWGGFWS